MKKILTKDSLDWFESNNISFHNRFGCRLYPGDTINYVENLALEPYVGFHAGYSLFNLGFMSFSNSALPLTIKIGRYCSIARGISTISYNHPYRCLSTSIFTHDYSTDLTIRSLRDFKAPGSFKFVANPQKGPIVIGHDVWIGQNSVITAGIKIGTGSIIAANAVVTRDVAPYTIVGGNPATLIKQRFPEEIVSGLIESRWWEYKYTDFYGLDISNPAIFLDQFSTRAREIEKYSPKAVEITKCPFQE